MDGGKKLPGKGSAFCQVKRKPRPLHRSSEKGFGVLYGYCVGLAH